MNVLNLGISYAVVNSDNVPSHISRWPGEPAGASVYKVPTCVAYHLDGGPYLWGFEAARACQDTYHSVKNFKPFLDPSEPGWKDEQHGRSAKEVTTDFLAALYCHLVSTLAEEGLRSEIVDYAILFTVPASFQESGIENLKQILSNTGFGRHEFHVSLTEPEAAALHTMKTHPTIRGVFRVSTPLSIS
jgi:molecular chaperone DnaK (HSP70)